MPSNSDPSMDATFLFKGTIRAVKSATMPDVPVDKNTVIAMVDQVLEAPSNLAKMGGHRVTVRLSGRRKVAVGDELIFHAHGWIFGASVAVQSLKEEPLKDTRAHSALLSRGGDPVVHRHNRQVQNRFSTADIVVSGRVTMVRIPEGSTAAPHSSRNVVIRFPASTDVRWYKAPKFQPGHQGFFMLRKHKLSESGSVRRTKVSRSAAAAEVFTALHPADFQPYTQPGGVRRIIENKDV